MDKLKTQFSKMCLCKVKVGQFLITQVLSSQKLGIERDDNYFSIQKKIILETVDYKYHSPCSRSFQTYVL